MIEPLELQLKKHEEQLDLIAQTLLEHSTNLEKIENGVFTKDQGREMMNTLDTVVSMLRKFDTELTFGTEWLKRLQKEVDNHRQDIQQIKVQAGMN